MLLAPQAHHFRKSVLSPLCCSPGGLIILARLGLLRDYLSLCIYIYIYMHLVCDTGPASINADFVDRDTLALNSLFACFVDQDVDGLSRKSLGTISACIYIYIYMYLVCDTGLASLDSDFVDRDTFAAN